MAPSADYNFHTHWVLDSALRQFARCALSNITLSENFEALPQERYPARFPTERQLDHTRPATPEARKVEDKVMETQSSARWERQGVRNTCCALFESIVEKLCPIV
jgi:hypothetical protein